MPIQFDFAKKIIREKEGFWELLFRLMIQNFLCGYIGMENDSKYKY